MNNFRNYLEDLAQKAKGAGEKEHDSETKLTITDLRDGNQWKKEWDQGTRWSNINKGTGTEYWAAEDAARIICKGIEGWMANFEEKESPEEWVSSQNCTPERMGVYGGQRDSNKCPYKPEIESWRHYGSGRVLHPGRKEDRTFIVCIDLVAIMLTVYQNIAKKEGNWVAYNQGKDICQVLYESYFYWGGRETARRIMKFWFGNSTTLELAEGRSVELGETPTHSWGKLIGNLPTLVKGIQCNEERSTHDKYSTTCVWLRNESGCQLLEDQDWENTKKKWDEQLEERKQEWTQNLQEIEKNDVELQKDGEQTRLQAIIRGVTGGGV
ncbi:hypothetical protein C922_05560, partial [Plasmodium inui San Antonio 1]